MKTHLPENTLELVTKEILKSFTHDEILEFQNFEKIWEVIQGDSYAWPLLEQKGIKSHYRKAYYDIKKVIR